MTDAQNATTDEAQPSSVPQSSPKSFADFGVRQDISDALAAVGIVSPFPIQEMTLPRALPMSLLRADSPPLPCTATSTRAHANRLCVLSATARWIFWWQPMLRLAVSMWKT